MAVDPQIAKFRINGLCSAPFTSFKADGSLDLEAIPYHVEELLRQGVHYAFVNGTTGEGYLCTLAERKALLEAWVAASAGRITVIAMVAAESLGETAELAAHAAAAGAAAIAVQPPTFFKPGSPADILPQLKVAADAAPALPLYYYHIAIKTGVNIRCDHLLDAIAAAQASQGQLKSFRGIKYSDADLHIAANCVAAHGGAFDIAYGKDEQALGALAMGIKGFVGSTYNYSGRVTNAVIAAFQAGDLSAALAHQRKAQQVVNLLYGSSAYGPAGCNVGKAIFELRLRRSNPSPTKDGRTVFCGPARWPNATVSEAGLVKLEADLEALGYFAW